ncbi:lasso peptide biosynthesis B2 protein [Desulfosediminicola flagellatus]|uniref:lasso peptide biosynthesis B2 protein n=1 Tax=Desulfosediminicola flagellatus TaxID=2569541 RepID=UPI0010AC2103|nr:lasso peptide biosynthesis B2 protein [Desulfosediminicola flagellatus]
MGSLLFRASKIGKFFDLNSNEKQIFLQAFWLLLYYRLSLKLCSLKFVLDGMEQTSSKQTTHDHSSGALHRICQLVESAATLVPYTTCLSKALAGREICMQNGFDVTLRVGVAKEDSAVVAHAWLTHSHAIVLCNLPDIDKYQELPANQL